MQFMESNRIFRTSREIKTMMFRQKREQIYLVLLPLFPSGLHENVKLCQPFTVVTVWGFKREKWKEAKVTNY